jgi:hypothetical protein
MTSIFDDDCISDSYPEIVYKDVGFFYHGNQTDESLNCLENLGQQMAYIAKNKNIVLRKEFNKVNFLLR